jgi:hypothetical protein
LLSSSVYNGQFQWPNVVKASGFPSAPQLIY